MIQPSDCIDNVLRVKATELKNRLGKYLRIALAIPVYVNIHGEDQVVIMSKKLYDSLIVEGPTFKAICDDGRRVSIRRLLPKERPKPGDLVTIGDDLLSGLRLFCGSFEFHAGDFSYPIYREI